MKKTVLLREIAHARSGDKGSNVNIGVIAKNKENYDLISKYLTADVVKEFFSEICRNDVKKYNLKNLNALNFILEGALGGEGGSSSLRTDSQGKAFGEALLHLKLVIS